MKHATALLQELGLSIPDVESLKIGVGEGGSLLSTGELRKVQLVRTLIYPKPIMMFDDPFAGLDEMCVRQVRKALESLKEKSIVLMVMRSEAEESAFWLIETTFDKNSEPTNVLHPMTNKSTLQII